MSESSSNFRIALELVLDGDQSATEELFTKYRRLVRMLAVGMLQQKLLVRVDESDIAQETMRKAVTDLGQFQGQTEAQFVDWLKTILRHTAQNSVRDHTAQKRDMDRTINESYSSAMMLAERCATRSSDCPQQLVARRESLVLLAQSLCELSDNERRAIEMKQLQGMKVDDIAVALEKTPVAVAGLIYRGMKKLKRLMTQFDGDSS